MALQGTTKRPPLILSVERPIDIVGRENMAAFTEIMRLFYREYNGEFPEGKIKKQVGPDERRAIAETISELQAHGFCVLGIDRNGEIIWGISTMGNAQQVFEDGLSEYQDKTPDELAAIARTRYRDLVKKQKEHRGSIRKIGNQKGRIADS